MRSMHILALLVAAYLPRGMNAFSSPTPPPLRYPVGYDPDCRERPMYYPSPDVLLPRPTRSDTKRTRWEPPRGYVPRPRSTDVSDNAPSVDRAPFINDDPPFDYTDGRVRLCTGIWMGRVILHKHCVVLEDNDRVP